MASQMRLELVQVPVSDIDRAKAFYVEKVGFRADVDQQVSDELRFVQLTPPGSACSIALTSGAHEMAPGSIEGVQMVVDDAEAARQELAARGVEVSDVEGLPVEELRLLPRPRRQRLGPASAAQARRPHLSSTPQRTPPRRRSATRGDLPRRGGRRYSARGRPDPIDHTL